MIETRNTDGDLARLEAWALKEKCNSQAKIIGGLQFRKDELTRERDDLIAQIAELQRCATSNRKSIDYLAHANTELEKNVTHFERLYNSYREMLDSNRKNLEFWKVRSKKMEAWLDAHNFKVWEILK